MLLVAPNTEAVDALDEKIQENIDAAIAHNVPVLYCLSRRLLGKAILSTMRQSILAIFDPDGAYDQFKIIFKYINANLGANRWTK